MSTQPQLPQRPDTDATEDFIQALPEVIKESKVGYRTTEFWLTILTLVALNSGDIIVTLPDKYQAIASAAVAGVYALSRGLAKKGVPDITLQTPPSA